MIWMILRTQEVFFFFFHFQFFFAVLLPAIHDINAKTGLPAYLIENESHFDNLMYSLRVLNPFVDIRSKKSYLDEIRWRFE